MLKKLFRSNLFITLLSYIFIAYLWVTYHTCRKTLLVQGASKELLRKKSPCVLPCWHSRFSMLLAVRGFGSFQAITSAHKDGNFLENLLKFFDHTAIRGSSRKKALNAARDVINMNPADMRLVITPDGPLGPRYKVKGMVVKLAKKMEIPIVPVSFSASHAIVLNTWDKFILPIPFVSRLVLEFHAPIYPGDDFTNEDLEEIMVEQMRTLDAVTNLKIHY